ncbi:MAG: 4-(cytidine 5'-diphospho)-2-C-methyl-D-erythritol kinase [Chloroflexota bacterium]|nr:4-(cytidine 5'-diphospho)-2-C-methyl-D-erythritol kinase [Chloroflexota bacterium]MDE2895905.1 4-(cytidine 5'-diphospho)-2-C-methyl-D-erythritol kinase [Chloroflexota bacterium]
MTTWRTQAAAKLNLTLEVIGKREDGYHDLNSVAVSLDLVDDVRLTRTSTDRSIRYSDEAGRRVSIETSNDIIDRAWSALERRCALPGGAAIEVVKRIPLTGGLGGGSADAAAFLRLARQAWSLDLSDNELSEIGSEVGSDVPACLHGGVVRMAGRGERIAPLQSASPDWAVLLHRPEIPVPANKTATMYRSLRSSDFRSGAATDALVESMSSGKIPTQDDCVNSFDRPAREVMQGLTPAWRTMGAAIARAALQIGAEPVTPLLAGAGPTLFAILDPDTAQQATEQLRSSASFTHVARPLDQARATTVQRD